MPQISDEEYAWLQTQAKTANFAEQLYNDPHTGNEVKRLIKQKYPQLEIPGYDARQYVDQRLSEEKRSRDEEKDARRRADEDRKWREDRERVQKTHGFTDETMKDMEDLMVKRNVGDYDVAATYYAAKNPKPSTPDYADQYWHHERRDGFADIAKDPEAYARREIIKTLTDAETRARAAPF